MDEKYEGMETVNEESVPEVDSESAAEAELASDAPDWEEELREEEVDEILGNDWTVGGELPPDSPEYKTLREKRRKRKGWKKPLQNEETGAEPGYQGKEKKEEKPIIYGITDISEGTERPLRPEATSKPVKDDVYEGQEPQEKHRKHYRREQQSAEEWLHGQNQKKTDERLERQRKADSSSARESEESAFRQDDQGAWYKKKQKEEEARVVGGPFRDPYEKSENQEIRKKNLHNISGNQSAGNYDSRRDQGIRNTPPMAAKHPEEARHAWDKLNNYRSHQSLYDFYAYAGRRVFEGTAEKLRGQQGTVSEGLRELRNNKIVRFVSSLGAGHGAASLYKTMRYTGKRIAEVAGKVEKYGLPLEVLKDKTALIQTMKDKKIIGIAKHDILKYRKSYLERAEVRELLRSDISVHRSGYSREDRRFIESQDFMAAKNPDRYAGVLSKYFRQNGYAFAEGNRLLNIGYRDLEKIMHHADNYGFHSSMDKKLLSQLAGVRKEKTLKLRAGKLLPGRAAGFIGMTVVEADPYLRDIAGRFSRGYTALRLKKEMTVRVSRLIGREVRHSFLRRAGNGIHEHIVSPMIRHVVKPVIRQAGKGVIKSAGAIKNTVKKAGKSAAKKAAETSLGRAYGKGKQAVRGHVSDSKKAIHDIGNRIAKTSPVRFTKRAGIKAAGGVKAGVKAGRKAAGYSFRAAKGGAKAVSRTAFILGTPFRFIGKLNAFLWEIRLKILMFTGGIALGILAFLLVVFERILMMQLIVAILSFDFGSLFTNIGSNVLKVYENYIEYSDYKDMRDDLKMLRELSDDTFQDALEIGNGIPEDDRVLDGHRITHYGSPDKDRGYTIHFLDPEGNELASRSNNVRDIEALCVAMIGNQMGEYASYSRDLTAFDALLKDMYTLMVPDISYEESEVYTCLHGCDTFFYHCNDPADYDRYYELWAAGVGLYEDLVEYNPAKEECGGHSVPVCYGHKDVDIYITLFDVEYAITHNIYPENWEDRPYAKMVKEFVDNGAWNSEFYPMLARNFIDPDWHDAYGYDPDNGAGYATADVLSDEDIADILERMDGDLSRARQEILAFALGSVGKIPYYWGGKADCWGYEGNNFGAPVKADRKGRDRKGLDCSGFVQWVYGSVLGITIPRSTGAYAGYRQESYGELKIGDVGFLNPPGAESNHMGIYAGKDASGNDLWIHCSSTKGSTYGTYSFKYFCNILN